MLGFCEFEEIQIRYSQFPGILDYDISTQETEAKNQQAPENRLSLLRNKAGFAYPMSYLMKSMLGQLYIKRWPDWLNGFQIVLGINWRDGRGAWDVQKLEERTKTRCPLLFPPLWRTVTDILSSLLVVVFKRNTAFQLESGSPYIYALAILRSKCHQELGLPHPIPFLYIWLHREPVFESV